MPTALMGLICGYRNECKMPAAILGLICRYCIFENLLMEFIIENDVSTICLKCVYYFKTHVSPIILNVSIAQCSF
jgi:hypothetical protein